jgi:hypothetical protein
VQGSTKLASDLDAYMALVAALAAPGADPEALFGLAGLDETQWEAIEAGWQARLSEAMASDDEGVPPLVSAYAEAFTRAQGVQGALGGPPLSFERFVEATRALQASADVTQELRRLGLGLEQFLAAQRHWVKAIAADPALSARFVEALR